MPVSQRGGRLSRLVKPSQVPFSGDTGTSTSNSMSNTATLSNDCVMSDELAEVHDNNTDLLGDYMFTPTATETDSIHGAAQLMDFNGVVTESPGSTVMAPGYFQMTADEYGNLESLFDANRNGDAIDMGMRRALNGEGDCTCHAGVTELLASMRGGGGGGGSTSSSSTNDQRLSLDAQLAKLKQCIMSSETSIGCTHGREDSEPIHIMAVAMLIGYVIDDFKSLASDSSLGRSSSLSSAAAAAEMTTLRNAERGSKSNCGKSPASNCTNVPLGGFMEPRLSWGVLELEEDDEIDLRQRLYLLSFRKLERLLSQLTLYLRDLRNAWASLPDPSRHMAFVIACDYMRLWLEQKACGVKRLFSVPPRDEAMNSALAYSDINNWCE